MVKVSLTLSDTIPIFLFPQEVSSVLNYNILFLYNKSILSHYVRITGEKHVFENIEELEAYYHIMTINIGHITIRLSI